jgi:parvulin-like peptidyl-prolyl isomerase
MTKPRRPTPPRAHKRPINLAAMLPALTLAACAADRTATTNQTPADNAALSGVERSERYAADRATNNPDQPATTAAEVTHPDAAAGFTVPPDELNRRLAEAAGAEILAELVLERLLAQACADNNINITDDLIRAERQRITDAFQRVETPNGTPDEDQTARLLDAVRARRGLGPERFDALIRRQAMMRALVAPRVSIAEEQIELAYQLRHGPRARVRVITTDRLSEARDALRAIKDGQPFAEVAQRLSTDSSAQRGGLIDPISPADTAFPAPIREAAAELINTAKRTDFQSPATTPELAQRRRTTEPIRLENGYAILRLEEFIPAEEIPRSAVADELAELMRRRQERLLMEQLARDLLAAARVTPRSPALRWSWSNRDRRQSR